MLVYPLQLIAAVSVKKDAKRAQGLAGLYESLVRRRCRRVNHSRSFLVSNLTPFQGSSLGGRCSRG
jgi:hypothetical protein